MKYDFSNSSGQVLSGRLELPSGKPRAYAIFAHCFTCSKDIIAPTAISRKLTEYGLGVLRFDFTGLGSSEGDFSNTNFSSNVADLVSGYQKLEADFEAPQVLIGHSLGGAAVLKAAMQLPSVKAVATMGAPSDVSHVSHHFQSSMDEIDKAGKAEVCLGGRNFTIKKQFIDDLNNTTILEGIRYFKKALLVMHAPLDQVVSVDHAAEIFKAAQHPKSFISLDSADHLLMNRKDAQYAASVLGAWLDRYLVESLSD